MRSTDNAIGTSKDIRRNNQTELFRGFHIDDEFEFCRLFYWQVCWLGALENLVHINGSAARPIVSTRAISSLGNRLGTNGFTHGGQFVLHRKLYKLFPVKQREGPGDQNYTISAFPL